MQYQPDIIAVTETRLKSWSNLCLIQIHGYQFLNRNSLSLAGGVGIYI